MIGNPGKSCLLCFGRSEKPPAEFRVQTSYGESRRRSRFEKAQTKLCRSLARGHPNYLFPMGDGHVIHGYLKNRFPPTGLPNTITRILPREAKLIILKFWEPWIELSRGDEGGRLHVKEQSRSHLEVAVVVVRSFSFVVENLLCVKKLDEVGRRWPKCFLSTWSFPQFTHLQYDNANSWPSLSIG